MEPLSSISNDQRRSIWGLQKSLSFVERIVMVAASYLKLFVASMLDLRIIPSLHGRVSINTLSLWIAKVWGAVFSPEVGVSFASKYKLEIVIGQTYEEDGSGNLDRAYVNAKKGFAFVLDGAGHNNPTRKKTQDSLIEAFIQGYEQSLPESFATVEACQQFLEAQLETFGKNFNASLADYTPAFLFMQVVQIGNERKLLVAHMADTALRIQRKGKKEDELLVPAKRDNLGFGSSGVAFGAINLPKIEVFDVAVGDVLCGFTDGIGEFLTEQEYRECLDARVEVEEMAERVIQTIKRAGEGHPQGGDRPVTEGNQPANGGKILKYLDPKQPQYCDDFSFFSFVIE